MKHSTELIYKVHPQDSALNLVGRHYDSLLHDFILSKTNKSILKAFSIHEKGKDTYRNYRTISQMCNGTSNQAFYFELVNIMKKMFKSCDNSTLFGVFLISVHYEQVLEFDSYFKVCKQEPGVKEMNFCECTAVCETSNGKLILFVALITFGSLYVVLILYSNPMIRKSFCPKKDICCGKGLKVVKF